MRRTPHTTHRKLQFLFVFIIAMIPITSHAQPGTFVHKFQLYFENAAGSRDTIEIRVDTLYSETFDPVYMQVYHPEYVFSDTVHGPDLSKSFEVYTLPHYDLTFSPSISLPSSFVNGLNHGTFNYYRSVTLDYNLPAFGNNGTTAPVILLFRCKRSDMPITIKWDKDYFNGSTGLIKNMHIVPEYLAYAAPDAVPGVDYWIDPDHVQCLRSDSSWTFHLGDPEDYSYYDYKIFGFIEPSIDTLWGLLLTHSYYDTRCITLTTLVPVITAIHITPNPATTSITLQTATSVARPQVLVYNNWGQPMPVHTKSQDDVSVQLDLTGYPPGMYWVELREEGIRRGVGRFVKME
jgi:hypothetical protein